MAEEGEEEIHSESEEEDGENGGTLKCTECDKTFNSVSKLKSHTRVHAGQNLFGCKHCPAKFVYENQLKLHSKIHEGTGGYACAKCPAKFTLAWSLKLHEKTHVTKKAFPCSECSAKFDSAGSLKEHEQSHRLPYACMQCTAKFSTARDLWEHENVHNDEESGSNVKEPAEVSISVATEQDSGKSVGKKTLHGCTQCSTWFVSRDHLQQHKCTKSNSNTRIEEKQYHCSQCSAKFAKKKNLKEHERKHAKKTKYTAKVSQKTQNTAVASSDGLSEIIDLTDSTDEPQNTTEYGSLQQDGAGSEDLEDEIVDVTSIEPTDEHQNISESDRLSEGLEEVVDVTSIEPTDQDQNTSESDHFQRDQRKTVDGKPQHTCLQCNATFPSNSKLNRHMTVHTGELKYHCSQCSAGFSTKKGLEKHMKRHGRQQGSSGTQRPAKVTSRSKFKKNRKPQKGAKPFSCPECPAKFVSYVEKKSHMKVHGQEDKTHICSQCGAKFAHYNSLVSHQRYHQGEKKVVYSCSDCPAKFAQQHSLWLHRRMHGEAVHSCPECPAVFKNHAHLASHVLVHSAQDKPYKCKHCSAQYNCLSHLTYHEKLHQNVAGSTQPTEALLRSNEDKQVVEETGEKTKLVVEETGKKRKRAPQQVVAPSKKSYDCKECPAKFTNASHLWSHMQVHYGGDKPRHCPHCSAKFSSPYHLSRHLKVHNETEKDGSPLQDAEATQEAPRKKQKKQQPPASNDSPSVSDAEARPKAPRKKQKKQKPPASNVRYSCSICSEEFLHPYDLKVHWASHTIEKIYSCDKCPASFKRVGHLRRHQKAHSRNGHYCCPYCSVKYDRLAHLRMHMRAYHSGVNRARPFVCPECPANYIRADHLKSHLKVHREGSVRKPYRCQHCTASFLTPSHLTNHMKLHTQEDEGNEGLKEHLCSQCPAGFKDARGLSEHLKIHTEKSNVCPECPARFNRPDHLRNHMLLHKEVEQDERRYHCKHCSAKFNAKHQLTNHEKLHSEPSAVTATPNETSSKCPHCLRRFKTVKTMKKHTRQCLMAIGNRPYTCPHCPAKFALASTLERHVKTHSCERPDDHQQEASASSSATSRPQSAGDEGRDYHCGECPAKFSSEYKLNRHQEIHDATKPKPYSCSYCSAKFSITGQLAQHVKIHKLVQEVSPQPVSESEQVLQIAAKKRDERVAFRCSVCSAIFTTQAHLNAHKEVHLRGDLYTCSKCPAKFALQSDLEDHKKTHSHSASDQESGIAEKSTSAKSAEKTSADKSVKSGAKKTKWFRCRYCKSNFRGETRLAVHINVHHWELQQKSSSEPSKKAVSNDQDCFNGQTYKCPQCPSEFTNALNLKVHLQTHQGKRQHKCQKCPAVCSNPSSLRRHMDTHHGNGIQKRHYGCPHCPARFIRLEHCKAHLIVHTREGPGLFRCTLCTAKFLHTKQLNIHMALHNGKKIFKCDTCSLEFLTLECLKSHLKIHPEKPSYSKQPSNAANRSTVQNDDADKRISSADRPYTCQKCSRKFLSSQQLEYHMVWHSGDRRHECSLCSQNFPTAQSLKEHRKTHAGERPFRCPMCPADFEYKSNLKRHVERKHFKESDEGNTSGTPTTQGTTHNAQKGSPDGSNENSTEQQKTSSGRGKSYACSACSKEFDRFKDLRKHRKTHSGKKRAKGNGKRQRCEECNATFSELRCLERHQRTHSGERPFACPVCSLRFARKDNVLRHVASVHKENEAAGNSNSNQEKHPKPDKKLHNCPECPARFSTVELLAHHKKIHRISSKGKATLNNNSSVESSNPATLEVMETQVVHEPGAASHVEAVVVANLEQLPIQESASATVQKVLQTDDQPPSSGSAESPELAQHHQPGSSSSSGPPDSHPAQTATVSRPAVSTHMRALAEERTSLQKTNEQVPAPGNVPLLNGLWQRVETTSPPQGLVPVALSYSEALQAGETILQASMANSYIGGNTIQQQITETSPSPNSSGPGRLSQLPHDAQLLKPHQGHSSLQQNDGRRTEDTQNSDEKDILNSDESKLNDIRYFCIGCKQVFLTEKDLKAHLQGDHQAPTPSQGNSSHHRIVMLQRKTTDADQGKTSVCSEANVLAVPKQSMNGVLRNCSHVFCVLCAGKVNINDISHHVKIKHGILSLDGDYPFGQATSCMTCSRRLYGEEEVQQHTRKRHIVLRDTAGPFLAYDNTQSLSNSEDDPRQDDRQHAAVLGLSTKEGDVLADKSSLSKSDGCSRMASEKEQIPTVGNSSSEKASVHSSSMTASVKVEKNNREAVLLKGAFSLNDAQKKKFLMISRAADACMKKKRYLVIRGSDGTDRSACSSPQTDCSSSRDTTSSPLLNSPEQLCHIKTEGGEKPSASSRLHELPKSNNNSTDVPGLQKQLALVASILSSTLKKNSSTEKNSKMRDHNVNSQGTKPTIERQTVKDCLRGVSVKSEPVTSDVDSADAGLSAASDAEDMNDLGDVTAINEPLQSIKEEAIVEEF
ncbi:uncharacterized protein LOC118413248 [Branchiostoma floridae]|uniref:Uncharacterized protein LOC118413248 n=1 Tax=Branchiostoma floridae TaxID=7739 RepID=A0A9J7KYY7_BRAFL|nr:uncharacterized protein LOC118413248 [Branchiostoma floridae]XP_035672385.1 uncharacterized protein LOC118413248 [Branchiostoma floridae]